MRGGEVTRRRAALGAVVAACVLLPGWSAAQDLVLFPPSLLVPNYNRVFPGLEESIEAGASLVRADAPPALWYNPAGLVKSKRTTVNASVQGYQITLLTGSNVLQGGVQTSNVSTVPTFAGIVLGEEAIHLKDLRFGFGITNNISWQQSVSDAAPVTPGAKALYGVNSNFTQWEASAALSWAVSDEFRLGFELAIPYTYLSDTGQLSTTLVSNNILASSTRTAVLSGYNFHILPSVSFQWEALKWLGLGAVVSTPGLRVLSGGSLTLQSLGTASSATSAATHQLGFRDTSATFHYMIPAEISAGAEVRFACVELEVDVHWYVANGPYTLLSSSAQVTTTNALGGMTPTTTASPFPAQVWGTRNIVDFNVGGTLRVSQLVKLIAGLYSDHAPGNVKSNIFQPITFYGARAGLSFSGSNLSFSLGLGYEYGRTTIPLILNLPGQPSFSVNQPLTAQTLSLLLAVAYIF
jgi:hypothetical protein